MESEKRVLILTYHYAPEPTSGALRVTYLAKYLRRFGWEPIVVTRKAPPGFAKDDGKVLRTGRAFQARIDPPPALAHVARFSPVAWLKQCVRQIVFFPDRAAWWIPFAVAGGLRAHRRWGYDAIVTSAMPASVHVAGAILARLLNAPWIADYRDLWNGNPYVEDSPPRAKLLLQLERAAIRRASALTTITSSLASALATLHDRPVRTIANASDAGEWESVPFEPPDRFRIVHAGTLYDGLRNPEPVIAQAAALRAAGEIADVVFDFYGSDPGPLLEIARRYGISDAVHHHGLVDRATVMRAERAAALLLIVQNADPRTATEYGSKIFEYEAAGPLVLALGPPQSVLRSYIGENALGWFASTGDEIRAALRAAYAAYRAGATLRKLAAVSAEPIAAKFAQVLNEVTFAQLPGCVSATGLEKKEPASFR